jgi:hypothetical protein
MTLTDLANHICEQTGMSDTDDVTAAKMFLQRRLEMIWNSQLWRASLVEATFTINTDGTCNLGDTYWIPARGSLLLPTVINTVLAVRTDKHQISVASLESYYRDVIDHLDMQGDPTEFQVLRPAVMELPELANFYAMAFLAGDSTAALSVRFSVDGVTINTVTPNPSTVSPGTLVGPAMLVYTVSKPATAGQVNFSYSSSPTAPEYAAGVNDTGLAVGSVVQNPGDGAFYQLVKTITAVNVTGTGAADGIYMPQSDGTFKAASGWRFSYAPGLNLPGHSSPPMWQLVDPSGAPDYMTDPSTSQGIPALSPTGLENQIWDAVSGETPSPTVTVFQYYDSPPDTAYWQIVLSPIIMPPAAGQLAQHQRIRLTSLPNTSVNLRVLGKIACPILGDFDASPINNSEPCLMAFARADMLMRSRQHGKAQQAMQEGAALLAQLTALEAFHQSSRNHIEPDSGFGEPNWDIYAPHL